MAADFYILSARSIDRSPAYCGIIEFEDIIVECLGAKLLTAENAGYSWLNNQQHEKILLVPAMEVNQTIRLLNTFDQHLKKFDRIYSYIFEPILAQEEILKPEWRKKFSNYYKTIRKLDGIFVPMSHAVKEFEQAFNIPTTFVPFACDALRFGGADHDKFIDVNGYGRQDANVSKLLSENINHADSKRVYYHTDNINISQVNDYYAYRRYFWKMLRKSKVSLAFDPFAPAFNKRFRFSFVALRWFESITAGCVVVGKKPKCEEMEELFPWENSTIELPENTGDILDFILDLLSNENNLLAISQRNYINALSRHDWRHRLIDMLNVIGILPPEILINQVATLKAKKDSQMMPSNPVTMLFGT
ncbi:hypothetical protein MCAMS1_02777 [biofilm metagenome]